MPQLTILPQNVTVSIPSGTTLIQAGEKAGIEMEAGCFSCSCGTCVVEIVSGMENLEPAATKNWTFWMVGTKIPIKFASLVW